MNVTLTPIETAQKKLDILRVNEAILKGKVDVSKGMPSMLVSFKYAAKGIVNVKKS